MRVTGEQGASITRLDQSPPDRWSERERASIYQHVLGVPGGDAGGVQSNREFADLWMRFVASVTQFGRQATPAPGQRNVSMDTVLAAQRDLAAAAAPRIDAARAHRDQWSVIDQVATQELGGAANPARQRALAQSGGAILEWLAAHGDPSAIDGSADSSLLDAAEQWLAVAGAADDEVAALAQPDAARRVADWSRALLAAVGLNDKVDTAAGGPSPRLTALFAGAPGTGKTLAAHWLASSLGRDVLHADLSKVVSKYIGETEKNLSRLFDAAERSGAVLLFDEADALFGKRTDVRDAHDRYANLETNFLLQRIESHDGVTLLATNAGSDIDPDVFKRINATVVTFPLPPR